MVLVLWDGPWVGPGKSKCCYFVDNTDVLGKQRFSLFFLLILKEVWFQQAITKEKYSSDFERSTCNIDVF